MTTHLTAAERVDEYVTLYVQLRDRIKEIKARHEEELKEFVKHLDELNGALQGMLDTAGAKSIKTSGGTVYASTRYTASLNDPKAFMDFVIAQNKFDLLDRKANATAVRDYIEQHQVSPPGVNLSALRTVGVRRAGE